MNATPDRTALVIGATGLFGLHAAEALIKHGWRVRALARIRPLRPPSSAPTLRLNGCGAMRWTPPA